MSDRVNFKMRYITIKDKGIFHNDKKEVNQAGRTKVISYILINLTPSTGIKEKQTEVKPQSQFKL